jgi:Glycosyltransferase like family 2
MRDRVIIPTYDRPEMLAVCLEHLRKCQEFNSLDVHVYIDRHEDQAFAAFNEIGEVIGSDTVLLPRVKNNFLGNSFNILMALHEAYNDRCKRVFLIEDDVMVKPDFFTWQYRQFEQHPDAFAVIGGWNTRTFPAENCGESYVTTGEDLCSIGVGYPRSTLKNILPHINYAYLSDMVGYCQRVFPEHNGNPNMAEQDGLIQRIMLREEHKVVWSNPSRAVHAGWYGYHRPNTPRPQGTLEERIAQVRLAIDKAGDRDV